ncbi:MAG: glycosyltransferase family 9 protein [Synergistaceae bacterium]
MGNEKKKVLLIRFSSLGDVVLANFFAKKIKQKNPLWHLTWLVDSVYRDIVIPQPWVDDVIVWNRKKDGNLGFIKIIKFIRSQNFDILIDMHNTDRSSLLSLLSGVPLRYADRFRLPFAHNIHSFKTIADESEKISECSAYLHPTGSHKIIDRYFNNSKAKKRLTLAIGASYENKRWPINRWIEFVKLALDANFILYLVGDGEDEIRGAKEVTNAVKSEELVDLVGRLSLSELVQVVNETDATISGDTGILHIARALGKHIIGLFGPNVLSADYMQSLSKALYCSCPELGCKNWRCSKPCLDTIPAEAVLESVMEIVERGDSK